MMVSIYKKPYWEKVVEYFYDNVWSRSTLTLDDWLMAEYGAQLDVSSNWANLSFEDEQAATLFVLRWE